MQGSLFPGEHAPAGFEVLYGSSQDRGNGSPVSKILATVLEVAESPKPHATRLTAIT